MTPDELFMLMQEGESKTLEFKERFSPSLARTIVAFANTTGGKILLGVNDKGVLTGNLAPDNDMRARIQDIAHNCDPPVKVDVDPVGKAAVIHVYESGSKPVQCSDGFFWRQGATTRKLSRNEIKNFFREEGAIRFDRCLCPQFDYPKDFDQEKFDAWLGLSDITDQPSVEDMLINIDAAEESNGKLLFRNAGVLFFAKRPRQFFPQAYITCLLAKGEDKVEILDRKDFEDGILMNIENAIKFVQRNTRTAYRFNDGARRENIPEYPVKALREAITNGIMHRDWFIGGANVFVEIYSDRIEVVSPGSLPLGMTHADLGSRSVRRNEIIADLLHRARMIERAGTGISRILNETRNLGCPDPKFESNGFFVATFWQNPDVYASDAPNKSGRAVEEFPLEVVLLTRCMAGEMTRKSIQDSLDLHHVPHFRKKYLQPALDAGLIEMTMPDKPRSPNQAYRLTPKGHELINRAASSGR